MTTGSRVGVLTTDRALRLRSWNSWLADATGLPEAQVIGTPLSEVTGGAESAWYLELFEEVLSTATPRVLAPAFHRYLVPCPPREASSRFDRMQQRVTVAPLRQGTEVVGLIVTVEDVTWRLDAERDLAAELQQRGDASGARVAVGASDWKLRRAAVETLRRSAAREDVEYLIHTLYRDHHDINVLSSALQVLTSVDLDVAPALIALLDAPDANLRMHAALALGRLRTDAAVAPLMAKLDDPDHNVRFHAIEALGQIGADDAVDALADIAASSDFFLAFAAIDAIAQTDDPRVAPRLVGLLEQEPLRAAIIDTLAVLGDEDCVPRLADLLNAGLEAPRVAAALAAIHTRYEETFGAGAHIADVTRAALNGGGIAALRQALDRRAAPLAALVTVFGWAGAAALPDLLRLLGEPAVRASVDAAVLANGQAAVEPLIELLQQGTRDERLAAASLLGRLGDRRAVEPIAALLDSPDTELVATAAGALAALADARPLDDILALFANPRGAVRQAAIAAVNAIGAAETRAKVAARLDDPDPHVRECATRVAGYFGFEDAVPAILLRLDDQDEGVRRAAIEQLPMLPHPRALQRLIDAVARETPRNRAAAAHALGTTEGTAGVPALRQALADGDPWVRYFAAGSLARLQAVGAAGDLVQRARTDAATHVRIAALHALGTLDAPELSDVAAELLDNADADLAAAALSAVARLSDARVDTLLESAARSSNLACRIPAVQAIASRGGVRAAELLAWAARMGEPRELAAVAMEGLRRMASAAPGDAASRAVDALLGLATESSFRDDALPALAALPEPAVDAVAAGLRSPRAAMRMVAVEALARMRQPRASQELAEALRDSDPSVRGAAVGAFGRLGTPSIAPIVVRLAAEDPDPGVRRRAEAVCVRHGWKDAAGQ